MATQALSVKIPQSPLPPSAKAPSSPKDVIEMAISALSKLICLPEPTPSPALSESESSPISDSRTEREALTTYFPSKLDPVYIPKRDDFFRRPFLLKLKGEEQYTHPVFTSDIDTPVFKGFLRTYVADRPFFDPRGPPEWAEEFYAVYEICRRTYVQKFTDYGHSMLYRTRIRDKGEVADLRMLTESIIGRPTVYVCRTVHIFEERIPYAETGFSPLPPPRPICARPTNVPHQPGCLCMKH